MMSFIVISKNHYASHDKKPNFRFFQKNLKSMRILHLLYFDLYHR